MDSSSPPKSLSRSGETQSLEERFPLRFYINLDRREDRRTEVENRFSNLKISIERCPAVEMKRVRNCRQQGNAGQYACRLSHRILLRRANILRSPTLLVFEDDVVFHPHFREIAESLQPPDDWGIILFGCIHVEKPEIVQPGWVRVKHFWGMHAYAVKQSYYKFLLSETRKPAYPEEPGLDEVLSRLSEKIPIYAIYPNLAWQSDNHSDLWNKPRDRYSSSGRQHRMAHIARDIDKEMTKLINYRKLSASQA